MLRLVGSEPSKLGLFRSKELVFGKKTSVIRGNWPWSSVLDVSEPIIGGSQMVALSPDFCRHRDKIIQSQDIVLPTGSREIVTNGLETMLCDRRLRCDNIRRVCDVQGQQFAYRPLLSDAIYKSIVECKFGEVSDDVVANFVLDVAGMDLVSDRIAETIPAIWLPTLRRFGEDEMKKFKIHVPARWSDLLDHEPLHREEFRPVVKHKTVPNVKVKVRIRDSNWRPKISFLERLDDLGSSDD